MVHVGDQETVREQLGLLSHLGRVVALPGLLVNGRKDRWAKSIAANGNKPVHSNHATVCLLVSDYATTKARKGIHLGPHAACAARHHDPAIQRQHLPSASHAAYCAKPSLSPTPVASAWHSCHSCLSTAVSMTRAGAT